MVDIHCHIIPCADDGAADSQTSILMSAMAADDGVDTIVATPHITWNKDSINKVSHIADMFYAFSQIISESKIPIKTVLGAEVLIVPSHTDQASLVGVPCIGKTKYVLVEFLFNETLDNIESSISALKEAGKCPIIAHPERYFAVQKNASIVKKWVESGAYLQLNKNSFSGGFGRKAKKAAEWMLCNGVAHFVASDAHDVSIRTTRMSETRLYLTEKFGASAFKMLTEDNPRLMLQNMPLKTLAPIKKTRA